jgi:predicted AlkP superfamily phosphohydrolase/phosphomutase
LWADWAWNRATANFLLDQVLRRLETGPGTDGLTYVDTLKSIYRAVAPPAVRNLLASLGQSSEQKLLTSDRRARKCFAVPHNENAGAIRINLVGREPDGKVERADLDDFMAELIKDLKDIVNLETGEQLVKDVVRVSEMCSGDHRDDLPDLLVLWHRPKPIQKIGSPKIGEIRAQYPGSRTGDHTKRMLMIACGPEIKTTGQIYNTSIMDVSPTIAALLGTSPQGMDGKVIPEVATQE